MPALAREDMIRKLERGEILLHTDKTQFPGWTRALQENSYQQSDGHAWHALGRHLLTWHIRVAMALLHTETPEHLDHASCLSTEHRKRLGKQPDAREQEIYEISHTYAQPITHHLNAGGLSDQQAPLGSPLRIVHCCLRLSHCACNMHTGML